MATSIIMPALEMAQETGTLVHWIKHEGESVTKGEPIMEIETDKVTVEIEAPASGTISRVTAQEGDVIPVGQTIGWILAPGESVPGSEPAAAPQASPLARRIAEAHGLDLSRVKADGGRVKKEDVLAYLAAGQAAPTAPAFAAEHNGRIPASPKARRLAAERGLALATLSGSGPNGAVLAADVAAVLAAAVETVPAIPAETGEVEPLNATWRVMAERMAASWTSAPHFFLVREVRADGLIELRKRLTPAVEKRSGLQPTFTDFFVKCVAAALRDHPRLNGRWTGDGIRRQAEINVGLAVGIEDGLVVPVIHRADTLSLGELAQRRHDLVARAAEHHLRPPDIADGTFTVTNLGMYNVDAFLPILNPPQAAILAIGRIADRVVPEAGQPVVRPVVVLTLVCDHRQVDGVRAAQFLDDLVKLIEEPWGLLA